MHLQVFPRTAAAASTAAETQEDEGESSGQEYESATDTEEVEGEGEIVTDLTKDVFIPSRFHDYLSWSANNFTK